jgi:GH15 family glucan-1,4-alpha-glucosidase
MKKPDIKELIRISKSVIKDNSLENGAIIAADSGKSIYPANVQDYRYVWIRDASYVCMSADLLGLRDISERFFHWCLNRAEGFSETGFFLNAYHVNGTIAGTLIPPTIVKVPLKARDKYVHVIHHGVQFQPDQNGSLLIAIGHHVKHFGIRNLSKYETLIQKTASGICDTWKKDRFILPYFDLWEERCILPEQKRYHTYSLAMCIAGLRVAIELLGKKKKWLQTEKEMSNVFSELYSSNVKMIPRTYSADETSRRSEACGEHAESIRKDDFQPDSSLLGLVYPSAILEGFDEKVKVTVSEIIKKNTIDNGGLTRYPGDVYCGGVHKGWVTLTGAGAWPLLNFWMAIYLCLCDDFKNAKNYFCWPLERIDLPREIGIDVIPQGKYIPEQIFKNKAKPSICPLVWSHAMFIIAAKFLKYL